MRSRQPGSEGGQGFLRDRLPYPTIRNYSPHTIDGYLRSVAQFATHFGTAPDRLGPEHIRTSQLHLLQRQVSESIVMQAACALPFLYDSTLHRPWMVDSIPYPNKPYSLPVI